MEKDSNSSTSLKHKAITKAYIALILIILVMGGIMWAVFSYFIDVKILSSINLGSISSPVATKERSFALPPAITERDSDFIRVDTPKSDELITSPVILAGEARGFWFFEGSFSVFLFDDDGNELVRTSAGSLGEWMTEDFVPFEAVLEFQAPASLNGALVFAKANPSGLPEHADAVSLPVRFFASDEGPIASGDCIISGCSNQICADENIVTTCEWLPEHECYKTARCERQQDGVCDWKMTAKLKNCLEAIGVSSDVIIPQ